MLAGRGPGASGWPPGRAFGRPELVWSSWCFIIFFNGQTRPRPSPKGDEALLGGRGGRQGPDRWWHDCRAPGCHFVTTAVVAAGGGGDGGGQSLAPSPRRAWTWRQRGEVAPAPAEALWDPMGVPSPCHPPGLCWGVAILAPSFSCPPAPHGAPQPRSSTLPFLLQSF